ncbi:MAG: Cytochrome c biogenesis protein CcsB [Calditrichaeota bacterium]|nr:Cytochrome c biogenesis protein CcsB [Calditrichota bacterium]
MANETTRKDSARGRNKSSARDNDLFSRLWNTLKSMKFAIILLLVITALTVVNLFANEFIVQVRGEMPGLAYSTYHEAYGEPRASVLTMLQMYAPYRSWWYTILLGLLTLSLVVCTIDRAPMVWKLLFGRRFLAADSQYPGHDHHAEISGGRELEQHVQDVIKRAGFTVNAKETKQGTLLHGRKSSIAHTGAWIVHVGFILLIVGAALIARNEYRENVSGLPGEWLEPDERAWGFNVRVEDFTIEYYPLREGQYVQIDGGRQVGRIDNVYRDSTLAIQILSPRQGFEDHVNPDRVSNRIDRRFGGNRIDQSNIADYIAVLSVFEDGEKVLTESIEVNHPLRYNGYRFYQSSFNDQRTDAQGRWTTVIEVRRDSGGPFVWAGIALVTLGLLLGLYLTPRDLFAKVKRDGERVTVLLAGKSKGRRTEFEQAFQRIVRQLEPAKEAA